jgi:hypothetical protein
MQTSKEVEDGLLSEVSLKEAIALLNFYLIKVYERERTPLVHREIISDDNPDSLKMTELCGKADSYGRILDQREQFEESLKLDEAYNMVVEYFDRKMQSREEAEEALLIRTLFQSAVKVLNFYLARIYDTKRTPAAQQEFISDSNTDISHMKELCGKAYSYSTMLNLVEQREEFSRLNDAHLIVRSYLDTKEAQEQLQMLEDKRKEEIPGIAEALAKAMEATKRRYQTDVRAILEAAPSFMPSPAPLRFTAPAMVRPSAPPPPPSGPSPVSDLSAGRTPPSGGSSPLARSPGSSPTDSPPSGSSGGTPPSPPSVLERGPAMVTSFDARRAPPPPPPLPAASEAKRMPPPPRAAAMVGGVIAPEVKPGGVSSLRAMFEAKARGGAVAPPPGGVVAGRTPPPAPPVTEEARLRSFVESLGFNATELLQAMEVINAVPTVRAKGSRLGFGSSYAEGVTIFSLASDYAGDFSIKIEGAARKQIWKASEIISPYLDKLKTSRSVSRLAVAV